MGEKLPKCLYFKHGSYYYVTRNDEGKKQWYRLGTDRDAAIAAAIELNKLKRQQRADVFGRVRSLYGAAREAVLGRDEYRCVYCGATEDLVMDHFIPYEAGGASHPCNIVTACTDCNSRKRGMDPKRFLIELDALRNHLSTAILGELGRGSRGK